MRRTVPGRRVLRLVCVKNSGFVQPCNLKCACLCCATGYGIMTRMRYWWANQKHTYASEVAGGYLWSHKRRADGSRNPFYETVRLAEPGDLIFAYSDAFIKAIGMVLSHHM